MGRAAIATSLVVLAAVAAPATGATPDPSADALASASKTLRGSSDLTGLPTVDTVGQNAATPSLEVADTGGGSSAAPQAPQKEPKAGGDAPDIAQTPTVSPAIPHEHAFDRPEASAEPAVGPAVEPSTPAPQVEPSTPAPQPPAAEDQDPVAPNEWQYRSRETQYRLPASAVDYARGIRTASDANTPSNRPQVHDVILRHICPGISCKHPASNLSTVLRAGARVSDQAGAVPAPGGEIDPGDDAPISSLLGRVGADDSCGNTNISFRISSPGDDAGVSQAAAAGDCGRNTNISIRINSPGNNGPVSQSVGTADTTGRVSSPLRASWETQLERSARRLARSLVAQAQAKANRALRQAAPRRSGESSHSTARVSAYSAASVAGARVAVSAGVSIRTSHRTQHARRTTRRTSRTAPRSRPHRFAASPRVRFPEVRGAGGSGLGGAAILIAFLAALACSYLLVPPLRARAIGPSLFRWTKRGPPPR